MIESKTFSGILVSIVVITYNSSETILDTLESIKQQKYDNIQLIISDDFSTDETVQICQLWLEKNQFFFSGVKLLVADENKGISANCNRGCLSAEGVWIKLIAGDDILCENCISDNVDFIIKNHVHRHSIIFSQYSELLQFDKHLQERLVDFESLEMFFQMKPVCQYEFLKKGYNPLPAITSFINREDLIELGYFDIQFPFMEDYPFWFKALQANFKLYYLPSITVKYRIHALSISNGNQALSKRFYESYYLFVLKRLVPSYSNKDIIRKSHLFLVAKKKLTDKLALKFIYSFLLKLHPISILRNLIKLYR